MPQGKQISVWLHEDEVDLVEREAQRTGDKRNAVIRRAIKTALPAGSAQPGSR